MRVRAAFVASLRAAIVVALLEDPLVSASHAIARSTKVSAIPTTGHCFVTTPPQLHPSPTPWLPSCVLRKGQANQPTTTLYRRTNRLGSRVLTPYCSRFLRVPPASIAHSSTSSVDNARTVTRDVSAVGSTSVDRRLVRNTRRPQQQQQQQQCCHGDSLHTLVFTEDLVLLTQAAVVAAAVVVAFWSFTPPDATAANTVDIATSAVVAQSASVPVDVGAIFARAGKASVGGGVSGAAAAVVQVLSLMWLRTTMNFQVKQDDKGISVKRCLDAQIAYPGACCSA